VVVDGFISTSGALIAAGLNPLVRDYLFAAHESVEIGHRFMLEHLAAEPILDLQLTWRRNRRGPQRVSLNGVKILKEMATFSEAGVAEQRGKVGLRVRGKD
jgi:nicotinate-nucleotide--dimethylbenzimidazole phosphoribosyltransferase